MSVRILWLQEKQLLIIVWNSSQEILSNTVNGTTYAGIRARTTGAPQNHWCIPFPSTGQPATLFVSQYIPASISLN